MYSVGLQWQNCRRWACAHAEFQSIGRIGGMGGGGRGMQNVMGLAKLTALGVCPCKILLMWWNSSHWACAHAKFDWFGRIEGIGCVPMQNFVGLGERKSLGVCPCRMLLI